MYFDKYYHSTYLETIKNSFKSLNRRFSPSYFRQKIARKFTFSHKNYIRTLDYYYYCFRRNYET